MKVFRLGAVFAVLLLAGCTVLYVKLDIDPNLEANAEVFDIAYPNSMGDVLSDKRYNLSFGPYEVTDFKADWRTSSTNTFEEDVVMMEDAEVTRTSFSQSLAYNFNADGVLWDATCYHDGEKRESVKNNVSRLEILFSRFTCSYKSPDNETWVLTILENDQLVVPEVRLTNDDGSITALAEETVGLYITDNEKLSKQKVRGAGYTWVNTEGQALSAMSLKFAKPQRVWLHKRNPKELNRALALANTGLYVYYWKMRLNLGR